MHVCGRVDECAYAYACVRACTCILVYVFSAVLSEGKCAAYHTLHSHLVSMMLYCHGYNEYALCSTAPGMFSGLSCHFTISERILMGALIWPLWEREDIEQYCGRHLSFIINIMISSTVFLLQKKEFPDFSVPIFLQALSGVDDDEASNSSEQCDKVSMAV